MNYLHDLCRAGAVLPWNQAYETTCAKIIIIDTNGPKKGK